MEANMKWADTKDRRKLVEHLLRETVMLAIVREHASEEQEAAILESPLNDRRFSDILDQRTGKLADDPLLRDTRARSSDCWALSTSSSTMALRRC